jgi:hypothetical protein
VELKVISAPSDPSRLRAIRLNALADSPASFGANHQIESEKPLNYWENSLRISNWCLVVTDNEDIGLLEASRAWVYGQKIRVQFLLI